MKVLIPVFYYTAFGKYFLTGILKHYVFCAIFYKFTAFFVFLFNDRFKLQATDELNNTQSVCTTGLYSHFLCLLTVSFLTRFSLCSATIGEIHSNTWGITVGVTFVSYMG